MDFQRQGHTQRQKENLMNQSRTKSKEINAIFFAFYRIGTSAKRTPVLQHRQKDAGALKKHV